MALLCWAQAAHGLSGPIEYSTTILKWQAIWVQGIFQARWPSCKLAYNIQNKRWLKLFELSIVGAWYKSQIVNRSAQEHKMHDKQPTMDHSPMDQSNRNTLRQSKQLSLKELPPIFAKRWRKQKIIKSILKVKDYIIVLLTGNNKRVSW